MAFLEPTVIFLRVSRLKKNMKNRQTIWRAVPPSMTRPVHSTLISGMSTTSEDFYGRKVFLHESIS